MTVEELEHKTEAVENASGRNVDTNFMLGLIATGIWQVALQIGLLAHQKNDLWGHPSERKSA